MSLLRPLVLLSILLYIANLLPTPSSPLANTSTAYLSVIPSYNSFPPGTPSTTILPADQSYSMQGNFGTQKSNVIPSQAITPTNPPPSPKPPNVSVRIGTSQSESSALTTSISASTYAVTDPTSLSSSVVDFLSGLLLGTNEKKVMSNFSLSPTKLLIQLANGSDEPPSQNTVIPRSISSSMTTRSASTPNVQVTPATALTPHVSVQANTILPASPETHARDTTFVSNTAFTDEHDYIRDVIFRMRQKEFVRNADYEIAKQIAQKRVELARRNLDTRTAFEKVMDWLGLASPQMAVYLEAQADLNDLVYARGLVNLAP